MNRVIFLNRFYWPEEPATAQLLTDLAEALAATGRRVRVITSHSGTAGQPADETRGEVVIQRLRSPRLGGRGKVAKAFNWATFALAGLWRVGRDLRRGDTVVLLTDPPLLAMLAAPLARARGARVVHWVQDIYPELPLALGARRLGWLRGPRDRAWRRADACVVPGNGMAGLVSGRGVPTAKIQVIPNWAPRGLGPVPNSARAAQRRAWGVDDEFVVAYSGNLGRVHDLEPVIGLAAALQGEKEMVFLFIGDGAQRPRLEELARAAGLQNLRFLAPVPRTDLAASLAAADVHLVTLRAGCERLVFPSKLVGAAAVVRPVLFIGPTECEPAQLVVAGKFGAAFDRDATAAMAETLRAWRRAPEVRVALGRAAETYATRDAGLAPAVERWQELLARLDQGASPPGPGSATPATTGRN
jgi:glycosyltransferase involved in cell wall biosynthesis